MPVLETLFEQRFLKSHFQIAITRKVFKLAPSNFPNFTLHFVAASVKACGKLNVKAIKKTVPM